MLSQMILVFCCSLAYGQSHLNIEKIHAETRRQLQSTQSSLNKASSNLNNEISKSKKANNLVRNANSRASWPDDKTTNLLNEITAEFESCKKNKECSGLTAKATNLKNILDRNYKEFNDVVKALNSFRKSAQNILQYSKNIKSTTEKLKKTKMAFESTGKNVMMKKNNELSECRSTDVPPEIKESIGTFKLTQEIICIAKALKVHKDSNYIRWTLKKQKLDLSVLSKDSLVGAAISNFHFSTLTPSFFCFLKHFNFKANQILLQKINQFKQSQISEEKQIDAVFADSRVIESLAAINLEKAIDFNSELCDVSTFSKPATRQRTHG